MGIDILGIDILGIDILAPTHTLLKVIEMIQLPSLTN